jgi:hypothetical protein
VQGLAFFRQLPRWARRLWYAILLVTAVELALFIVALVWAPGWIWLASEMFSLSAWPLGVGVVVVVVVGTFSKRRAAAAAVAASSPPSAPQQPAPGPERPSAKPAGDGGYEIAAARGAARLLAQAARRPEGKAAVRRTARLVRAVRAAATPPEPESGGDRPKG